jgi:hypothetical protein
MMPGKAEESAKNKKSWPFWEAGKEEAEKGDILDS